MGLPGFIGFFTGFFAIGGLLDFDAGNDAASVVLSIRNAIFADPKGPDAGRHIEDVAVDDLTGG